MSCCRTHYAAKNTAIQRVTSLKLHKILTGRDTAVLVNLLICLYLCLWPCREREQAFIPVKEEYTLDYR